MKSMEEMIQAAQAAAETIQKQMGEAQKKLDQIEVQGISGGGLVKIRASAKGRILSMTIDDSLMQMSEKGMLEDLIVAAFNDAKKRADEKTGEEMERIQSAAGSRRGSSCRGCEAKP